MKKSVIVLSLCVLLSFNDSHGQAPGENAGNPYAVGTYECAGIYWETPEAGVTSIRYREVGESSWKQGLELVYDPRNYDDSRPGEYRGSIINLKPNTEYEVELSNSLANARFTFKTRNDNFPIGKTTILPERVLDEPVVITESGTPDAYHLITVPDGSKSVLNLNNYYDYGIEIDADYVIIRGLEIRNARIHGILIRSNRHNIVIEQSYITFWGRIGGPRSYGNVEGGMDSGIFAEDGAWNITIQRNLIENPRGATNDWSTGHPSGPQGISFRESKGGNVIRYNEIVSTEKHPFNDGIGGSSNFSLKGNMNRDSDIYGNIVRNAIDDAIEVEGGNRNVRIWGNYLDLYFQGIATAATNKGPIYIFRNVFARSRVGFGINHAGSSMGGAMFKVGGRWPGRRYFFHNTSVQPNGAFQVFTWQANPNAVTRNNIFDVPGRLATDRVEEPLSDYDYDYFAGTTLGTAQQENDIWFQEEGDSGRRLGETPSGTDFFIPSYNLEFYPRSTVNVIRWGGGQTIKAGEDEFWVTDPVVHIKSPLIGSGAIIPGFNDDYIGEGPDIGAFEVGAPPLEFGRRAYLNYDEGWAPWERY